MTSLVSESLQRRVCSMALSELGAFLRRSAKALSHPQYLALLLGQPKGDLSEKPHLWEKASSNRALEMGLEYLEQRLLGYQSDSRFRSHLCPLQLQ